MRPETKVLLDQLPDSKHYRRFKEIVTAGVEHKIRLTEEVQKVVQLVAANLIARRKTFDAIEKGDVYYDHEGLIHIEQEITRSLDEMERVINKMIDEKRQ